MSKSITLYLIFALLVLFTVACSGGKGDPVAPDLKYQEPAKEAVGTKMVAGVWHIAINKNTGAVDIADLRTSKLILNVLGFMEPPVLSGVNIDLASLVIEPPIVEVDVILSHPIPDTVFMGFDVRGVVFGPKVVNADGLTILTGPEYFKDEAFGYIDGLLGAPDSYGDYAGLFGYKYFCDGLGKDADLVDFFSKPANLDKRGVFKQAPNANKRHYIFDWTDSNQDYLVFNYAMYVNYDWPTSSGPPSGVKDFDINTANSAEAFCCKVTEAANNMWYSGGMGGGKISLNVEAWDWQGDIADATIESPSLGIPKTPFTLSMGKGSTNYSYLYSFDDITVSPNASGEHGILITITDSKTFGGYWFMDLLNKDHAMYNDQVFNCFLYTTTVMESPPVEVWTIDPNMGETSTYLTDVTITGDNFSDPAQVKLKLESAPDIDATNVVVLDISTITCDIFVPFDGVPGFYDVEVTAGTGVSGVGEGLFEVFEILPVVNGIDPNLGETSSYIPDIVITGDNFVGPGAQVKLKMDTEPDIEATNVVVTSTTTVRCDIFIPYHTAIGLWDVEVTNGTGKSGVGESLFNIIDTSPRVISIVPTKGETGTDVYNVTVTGGNFEGPNAQVKLKMVPEPDIVATYVVVVDINTITCDISIPNDAAIGFRSVEVTNFDGKYGERLHMFEVFTTNPLIFGIDPNEGGAGTDLVDVAIFGDNFVGPSSQVVLKMASAPDILATNVTVTDQSNMGCDISIPIDAPAGIYDVEVTNNLGKTGTGQELFRVLGPPPEVSGIDPDNATPGTNLPGVTVSGSYFVGSVASVILQAPSEPDITATNVVVVDSTTITCDINIPVNAWAGLYDVEVINGDGQNGVGNDLFEVICPTPVINMVIPDHGNKGNPHFTVTINGLNFVGLMADADVRLTRSGFPDIVGMIQNYNMGQIGLWFDLTNAELGAWDVQVTNGCGSIGVKPGGFTVD